MGTLRFDGHFVFARPLTDLATVFDMTGLAIVATRSDVRSEEPGLLLQVTVEAPGRYRIAGAMDRDVCQAEDVLARVAAAFEADGIDYSLALYETTGTLKRVFEPIG